MTRLVAGVLALIVASSWAAAGVAKAQVGAPSEPTTDLEEPSADTWWRDARPRAFFSTMVDLGFLYLRPRAMAGFGRPFHRWVGVETNPILSTSYLGGYLGLRGAMPSMDLRLGTRLMKQIRRSFVQAQADDSYGRRDVEDRSLDSAAYLEIEGEYSASIHAGPGNLLVVLTGTWLVGVPDGQLIYEDSMRIVAAAPGFWRARLGYAVAFDVRRAISVGVVAEVVSVPRRDATTIRGGLVASVKLWPNLEVRASLIPVLASPDDLGASGGDFGNLGIRWSWASR